MEVALMIMDGSKTGKADPACAAHMDVALHWAQAIWNKWLPVHTLQQSVNYARERISRSSRPKPASKSSPKLLEGRRRQQSHLDSDQGNHYALKCAPTIDRQDLYG